MALLVPTVAAARIGPITGSLDKQGYTVIAIASDGRAKAVAARRGSFRVVPPAKQVTLHLRAPGGQYAGPVVLASLENGSRAAVRVNAGTRLGRIAVSARKRYARVIRTPRGAADSRHRARASKGVPIGARSFGRVRSKPPRSPVPGDRDNDGVQDPLDIDDDGDLILDNLEQRRSSRAAQVTGFDTELHLMNVLPLGINGATNRNAGTTIAESDAMLAEQGYLIISELRGDSVEIDCSGLSYCSPGGTGYVFGTPTPTKFPECCDADGDGMGSLARNPSLPTPTAGMFLHHGATSSQIKTGDVIVERVTDDGVETAYTATLQYVFGTIPSIVSYSDGAGNKGDVKYPVQFGAPGTPGHGFPVGAGPGGDVVLRTEFWRPQRRSIVDEAGGEDWIDVGGLTYTVRPQDPIGPQDCPRTTLSEPSGGLVASASPDQRGYFDSTPDRPANPNNKIGFTVNVSKCLELQGGGWDVGEEIGIGFRGTAGNGRDGTDQTVWFTRTS
jgi:hypothetical protein